MQYLLQKTYKIPKQSDIQYIDNYDEKIKLFTLHLTSDYT